jgi:hypothetical protein
MSENAERFEQAGNQFSCGCSDIRDLRENGDGYSDLLMTPLWRRGAPDWLGSPSVEFQYSPAELCVNPNSNKTARTGVEKSGGKL